MLTEHAPAAVACAGLSKSFGSVRAVDDASLDVRRGEILALLGPSGCGKTTFLRILAGFERPDAGRVTLDDRVVCDDGAFVPPERRRVGFVFQDYALFPHLTVAQNVGYGLARRDPRREQRIADVLALVGLAGLGERLPSELSGGQQQRVALARALAPEPSIVLLDEPFSSLDADLRARVRGEVREILRSVGATTVFVTHDQQEAFSMADRLAVMRAGRIEQVGRAEEIYHTPVNRFVADFVGRADFLPGVVEGGALVSDLGRFDLGGAEVSPGGIELMVRPEDVAVEPDPSGDAVVAAHEFRGPMNLTWVRLASGRILTAAHSSQVLFHDGERVRVSFEPDHLVVFRGEERVAWVPTTSRTGTDPAPDDATTPGA